MNPAIRAALKKVFGPAKRKCETSVFWLRHHIVLGMDLQAGAAQCAAKVPILFRLGTVEDLEYLARVEQGYDARAKAIDRERMEAGGSLLLGSIGPDVVFHAWLMYGEMDLEAGRVVPSTPDKVYSYRVFTSPQHRGLGICPAFYSHIARLLREHGYRLLFCRVISGNTPSMIAHQHAGFTPMGALWEVQLGKGTRYLMGPRLRRWLRTPVVAPAAASLLK
jgi:GNAT superfamily N-acetyltransferase